MGDLIRRSEAIKMIDPCCRNDEEFQFFKILLEAVPSVDAVPVVHGEWIAQNEGRTKFLCSHCKTKNHAGHEKFCPNCGAAMDGKKVE